MRARIQLYITDINYRTCKYSTEKKQYIFKRFRTDSTLRLYITLCWIYNGLRQR